MSKGFETIGEHRIYFNEEYYLVYAGGKRELPEKKQKEYQKIMTLPSWAMQRDALRKISQRDNPNMVPLSGRLLLELIRDLKFIPFFDSFFKESKRLVLNDVVVFETIKALTSNKSAEIKRRINYEELKELK